MELIQFLLEFMMKVIPGLFIRLMDTLLDPVANVIIFTLRFLRRKRGAALELQEVPPEQDS